jgi:hypothetical protein
VRAANRVRPSGPNPWRGTVPDDQAGGEVEPEQAGEVEPDRSDQLPAVKWGTPDQNHPRSVVRGPGWAMHWQTNTAPHWYDPEHVPYTGTVPPWDYQGPACVECGRPRSEHKWVNLARYPEPVPDPPQALSDGPARPWY